MFEQPTSDPAGVMLLKAETLVQIVEYVPHAVVCRTLVKKLTGSVSLLSFDTGETLTEKVSPFDVLVQILEGHAEIRIGGETNLLQTGEVILIPAHRLNSIYARQRFKMLLTVIKSGYEI